MVSSGSQTSLQPIRMRTANAFSASACISRLARKKARFTEGSLSFGSRIDNNGRFEHTEINYSSSEELMIIITIITITKTIRTCKEQKY